MKDIVYTGDKGNSDLRNEQIVLFNHVNTEVADPNDMLARGDYDYARVLDQPCAGQIQGREKVRMSIMRLQDAFM